MIGEQILNYRIISKLGDGGMGTVYLATHIQLDRKAAIKALHPNLVNNPQIRERFKNEASTMARLQHNNIVNLYDYLEATNGLFLIMEYVPGKPLDTYIQQVSGPMPEEKAVDFFVKILDGFEYAHNQGVVHRDIKPSNLIITPEGEVKILDFGIAKLLAGSSKSMTKTGSRMGTVLYMSPEQVKGLEVDRRSDIYSLGVTLFQMLTARCPYDEANATEYDVYNQIVNFPLPRAKTIYPKVSDRMQAIIDKATAKNPDDRFQSCEQFKRALLGIPMTTTIPNSLNQTVLGNVSKQNFQNPNNPINQNQIAKPRKHRRNSWIPVLLILFFLGSVAAFVVLNPLNLPFLKQFAWIASPLVSQEPAIKEKVRALYKAVESRDFQQIAPFYADTLENYFGNLNRRLKPDIKAAYDVFWKSFAGERHELDWETFTYNTDELGNHVVQIEMKYYFKMNGKDWDYLKTKAEIKFNQDLKIFYIVKPK